MTITGKKEWGVLACAIAGVVFVCAGLWLATLSNPQRFSLDRSADRQIHLLSVSGLLCTIAGIVLLLTAGNHTTKSMPPQKRTNTNIGVGVGFVLQLAGLFLLTGEQGRGLIGLLLILTSLPAFIWGCLNYAEGKGHSKWVGVVGMAGLIGLIILIGLSDQNEEAR